MLEQFVSIKEIEKYFSSEDIAVNYLENFRWSGKPKCPKCGHDDHYTLKTVKQYCCKKCRKAYTVKVGTIFDNTKVPLTKWFTAIFMLMNDKRSVSSVQISEWIGVTQKTAWFMNHRIRTMLNTNNIELIEGTIEIDEVYIGGKKDKANKPHKEKLMQGSGSVGKYPVVGIAEAGSGKKIYIAAENTITADTIKTIIDDNVSKETSTLVTDGSPLYTKIGKEFKKHIVLNHTNDDYKKDGYHSNNIEGSFRHFRGCLDGTFKGRVRQWHLQKYANEFIYKNNRRAKNGNKIVLTPILTPNNLQRVLRYKTLISANPDNN